MWLTTAAVVLLVPATAALLSVSHSPHRAAPRGLDRRMRVAVGATAVALGAMPVVAALGAGPLGAVTVAGVLAAAVGATAPVRPSWAARGVVVRALLVAALAGGLLWLAHGAVVLGPPLPLLGLLLALLVVSGLAAVWLLVRWDTVLGRRAGAGDVPPRGRAVPSTGLAGTRAGGAAAVAALVVPAAAVGVVTTTAAGSAPTAERAGGDGSAGGATPGGTNQDPGRGPSGGTLPSGTWPSSAAGLPSASRPAAATASGSPDATAVPTAGGSPTGSQEPSPGATPATTSEPAEPSASQSPSESGLPTLLPWPAPEESKTPGYAKDKPNRASGAPSPGGGKG